MTDVPTSTGRRGSPSPRRFLLFTIATPLVALALGVALEFGLSFLHLERFDREFTQRSSFPIYVPGEGPHAGYYVTNRHFWQTMNFQRFRMNKPSGVFRIFVLGGSAAYGFPGTDTESFTGYLRRALDAVVPSQFEIVNAAGISYGSHRVLDVFGDVMEYEPDLVIIYSGSNEYVERNVLPAGHRGPGGLSVVRDRLSRTQVYRAVRLVLARTPVLGSFMRKPTADITDIRSNPLVHRGQMGRTAVIDREVLENYQANMTAIADALEKNGVPGLFCSEPVSLVDWRPEGAPPRFSSAATADRWRKLVDEGTRLAETDPGRADPLLQEALLLAPDFAPAAFSRGRALLGLGRRKEAEGFFELARERDTRPMRALASFTAALRRTTASRRGIRFLDLAGIFAGQDLAGQDLAGQDLAGQDLAGQDLAGQDLAGQDLAGQDLAGRDFAGPSMKALLLDYCHPGPNGHKLTAVTLLPLLAEISREELPLDALAKLIERDETADRPDPILRARYLSAIGVTHYYNGRLGEAETAFREALTFEPGNPNILLNLGAILIGQGRLEQARDLFLQGLPYDPVSIEIHYNLGIVYFRLGDMARAAEHIETAYRLNPLHSGILLVMGDIERRRGDWRTAIRRYREALDVGADSLPIRLGLAGAYLGLGDRVTALRELEAAATFDPADAEIRRLQAEASR
jgi:tetratricopeptide (TPR) repeat protein